MLTMARYRRQFILTLLICTAAVLAGCADDSPVADTEENLTMITADDLTEERNLEANSLELGSIPDDYYEETEQGGTLETFSYECAAGSKNVTVYLPYGYDDADSETKYDILYLMHGAGGNETTYLGSSERPTELKNILDQMIARQDIKPTIVVCPALNRQGSLFDNDEDGFCEEWRQSIVPAVEGHYHTYAETTDSEGLRASREHRMFGGFSAGSTTTWYAFLYDLDYIGYFLNMSSDCWVLGMEGGRDHPEETAEYLSNAARESGYGTNDYYIFAATGTDDHAYENLNNQIAAMAEKTDVFHYSDNGFTVGNLTYYTVEGNKHDYPYTYEYLYNGLRSFASVMSDDFYVASESSGLVSTNGDYPPLESVPSEYETSSEYGGTLQELSYVTKDYGGNGAVRETSAMVYLPYGYDSDDTDPAYDYSQGTYGYGSVDDRAELYREAERLGVGITVMKPFAGGQLLDEQRSPLNIALSRYQCIQYALDRPAVLSCLPGVGSVQDVKNVLGFYDAPAEQRDYSILGKATPSEAMGRCVYCNHCAPCPKGIDIGLVNKYYDLAKVGDGLAKSHYKKLSIHADACVQCGHCERRCPFHVKQMGRMKAIRQYFEFVFDYKLTTVSWNGTKRQNTG